MHCQRSENLCNNVHFLIHELSKSFCGKTQNTSQREGICQEVEFKIISEVFIINCVAYFVRVEKIV